ncbi:unnamed protein product [Boreogadus saida]
MVVYKDQRTCEVIKRVQPPGVTWAGAGPWGTPSGPPPDSLGGPPEGPGPGPGGRPANPLQTPWGPPLRGLLPGPGGRPADPLQTPWGAPPEGPPGGGSGGRLRWGPGVPDITALGTGPPQHCAERQTEGQF